MILVLSDAEDFHVRLVMHRLTELGEPTVRFSLGEFPRSCGLAAWLSDDGPARVKIRRDRGDIDFSAIKAVWCRRLTDVWVDPVLSKEDAEFSTKESNSLLYSLSIALGDRFWVNPFANAIATDRGNGKVSQLEIARQVGFAIPRTLATNDPAAAREFVANLSAGAIYKPLNPPTRNVAKEGEPVQWASIYTNKLDDTALESLDGVRLAPCLFQELVPKRLELRVTVIGTRVFATEIHSQVDEKSSIDFRRHYNLGETPYAPHDLPSDVIDRCLALNQRLGLVFGAMDFILTPDGRYVFLEVNQQGQFMWLEQMTGQPLLEHFCELLRQGRPDYRCDAAMHTPGMPGADALSPVDPRDIGTGE